MNELQENARHNREQELIGKANVISNIAGSLASIYTKRIPSALKEARQDVKAELAEVGRHYNKQFSRRR